MYELDSTEIPDTVVKYNEKTLKSQRENTKS